MKRKVIIISAVLGSALLASCASVGDMKTDHGNAVKKNIAVQSVQPTAEQKNNTYIRPDTKRMSDARDRYRKDKVETPRDLSTVD